jgi:MFS family permease
MAFKQRSTKIISLLLILTLVLAACTGSSKQGMDHEATHSLLSDSINNLRELQSFHMDVTQGGTPYLFYFQLGPGGFEFVTAMTRAEGAYIAPDKLLANARIDFRGVLVNIGLFADSAGQWLRPLSANWVEYEYAPGFDPRHMMRDGYGFQRAIDGLTELEFVGYETRAGTEVLHLRGNATNEIVNSLLFGLLSILEDKAIVDIFVDAQSTMPSEILLTLPDSSTPDSENTFWKIELYDLNQAVEMDTPQGLLTAEILETPINRSLLNVLVWVSGMSALLGAAFTPFLYWRKGRSITNGLVLGAFVGGLSSILGLIPLWLTIHPPDEAASKQRGQATLIDYAALKVNPWVVIAFIAIPVFVGSLDLTVVSAFLPELVFELGLPFDTGLDDASWIVTAYLLAYTVSLTFMGRLSDLLGRRAIYMACLLVFIAGSVWVAVAHLWPHDLLLNIYYALGERPDPAYISLQAIIIGRTIQALGAGALVPVSLALVGDIFPPDQRARPLGLVAAMDTLGWVLGPVYGGLFMQIMPWQGLFWLNVPLTLLALFSVLYALSNVPMRKAFGQFDFLGTVLIVAALSAMSIGLGANIDPTGGAVHIENLKPLPDYALPLLGVALVLFLGFILVESRLRDPLIKLDMFKRKNLSAAALVNLLIGYCLFIGLVSVPILINLRQESVSDLSQAALQVGAMLSTLTLPMAFAAVPGGWLSEQVGVRETIILGLLLSLLGFLLIWQTWTIDINDVFVGIQMALVGIGIGLTFSPVSTAIINSAHDEERGVAGAIVLILRLIGMTISISSLSSIMFYRVNALAAEATAGIATLDTTLLYHAYTASAIQVLGEMGLIGAVLTAIALIPAAFIDKRVDVPVEEKESKSDED